jgi:hypothetical protein
MEIQYLTHCRVMTWRWCYMIPWMTTFFISYNNHNWSLTIQHWDYNVNFYKTQNTVYPNLTEDEMNIELFSIIQNDVTALPEHIFKQHTTPAKRIQYPEFILSISIPYKYQNWNTKLCSFDTENMYTNIPTMELKNIHVWACVCVCTRGGPKDPALALRPSMIYCA